MAVTNNFTEPPPQTHPGDYSFSSTIQYGSPQQLSWTENYNFPLNLVLWQETYFLHKNYIPPHTETLATNLTVVNTSYSWDGKPTQNLSLSNLFWLGMHNSLEVNGPLFKSQYFNVTMSASSSSTTSSSSSITSSSSSSSSTPTAQPVTTPTSTTPTSTTPSASPTPKPTNHVALGAGLGAGLGGAALLLAVALFFFPGRKWHSKGGKPGRPEVYQLAENDTFSR